MDGPAERAEDRKIGFGVHLLKAGSLFRSNFVSSFSQQSIDEEASAHADSPVNAPHGQGNAGFLERLIPGEDVLIDAADQRSIEIKKESCARAVPGIQFRWDDLRFLV